MGKSGGTITELDWTQEHSLTRRLMNILAQTSPAQGQRALGSKISCHTDLAFALLVWVDLSFPLLGFCFPENLLVPTTLKLRHKLTDCDVAMHVRFYCLLKNLHNSISISVMITL
jgi:hypothetical protein